MNRKFDKSVWSYVVFAVGLLSLKSGTVLADWPQFRGKNSEGVYQGAPVPTEFGPTKNRLWTLDVPEGHSSPVIHGGALYLTSCNRAEKTLSVHCIDRQTGKSKWTKAISVSEFERGHPSFNPASSSPATDGERVVAYFGSYGLVCYDRQGNLLWEIKMPVTKSYAGNATSPAIVGDKVILYRGNLVDHYVLAVDKATGKEIWKVPQQEPFALELACTSCPVVFEDKLVLHSARSVQALALDSGKRIWEVKCATTATSTPVIAGDQVIVAAWNKMGEPALRPRFPTYPELIEKHDSNRDQVLSKNEYPVMWIFHRPEGAEAPENGATLRFRSVDQNKDGKLSKGEWEIQLKRMAAFRAGYKTHGMLSIPIQSQGKLQQTNVKTLVEQGVPEVPSPLVHQGLLYFVKNGGSLSCVDLQTGKRVYRIRTKGKGTHYASPVIVNDCLYSFAGDGQVSIVSVGRNGKVIATNKLDDRVYASPAVKDGVLYVRTHSKLYAFGFK